MDIGMILGDRSDWSSLVWDLDSSTSFLCQEDGAVGGVAARLEEGGKAGEELRLLDFGPVEGVTCWEDLRRQYLGERVPL